MAYVSKNNAYSTLAAGITNAATSLQVAAGHGDRFPVVAGSDYTYVTLEDPSGNIEIVKVTARASASDTMTIVRAQEGTTARAWNSGDVVEHRLTAGVMEAGLNAANDLATHLNDTADAHAASAITNTPAGNIAATTVQAALNELDSEKAAAADLTAHLNDTTAAHAASAISYAGGTGMSATDVEAAIDELATEKLNAADAFLNSILAKTAAYTVVAADRGKLIDCDGTFTLSLTAAATLGNGFTFGVRNSGTGTITIDPAGTEMIDGVETINLGKGDSALVTCSGTAFKTASRSRGKVLQVVRFDTGEVATGTTLTPNDDTIPQQTEGDQYMSLSITPKEATSSLLVNVTCVVTCGTADRWLTTALFRDAGADAIRAAMEYYELATELHVVTLSCMVAASAATATEFKVRVGPNAAATVTFNGIGGIRKLGGTMASSITITEIAA